jgi:hypothetical protein
MPFDIPAASSCDSPNYCILCITNSIYLIGLALDLAKQSSERESDCHKLPQI